MRTIFAAKQLNLLSTWQKDRYAFGGSNLKNSHAKTKRPFSRKLPLHVVMRSSQAKGSHSLSLHNRKIEAALFEEATRQHLKLHSAANAGNHLHLLVQAPSREQLSAFLKAVSGRIAMIVTGARKGASLSSKFWDQRPFTRLVNAGRDFMAVRQYLAMNSTESAGLARPTVRAMFAEIRERIRSGQIPRSLNLKATGFC
jgi:REP element-mobilizing transposase RayT